MLDGLKALIALESTGTISEAAVRLRLTQSAVSKRIQSLELELGFKLTEVDGRKLKLSRQAIALISRAKPLLSELENLKLVDKSPEVKSFSIGMADSIASTWGAALIKKTLASLKGVELEIHVHRSTLILEQLRLGHYELGIVSGARVGLDLIWTPLATEGMVLAGKKSKLPQKIFCIETASATGREIGVSILKHEHLSKREFVFVESFTAAGQLAKQGLGQALIPTGVAQLLGFRTPALTWLSPRVSRQIHLVARKSIQQIPAVSAMSELMTVIASKLVR